MVDPSPAALWAQAEGEPERYLDLMVKHGYVVPREPGDTSPLFSCGHDPRHGTGDEARAVAMEMTALAKRLIREHHGMVIDPMVSLDVSKVKAAEEFLRRNP